MLIARLHDTVSPRPAYSREAGRVADSGVRLYDGRCSPAEDQRSAHLDVVFGPA